MVNAIDGENEEYVLDELASLHERGAGMSAAAFMATLSTLSSRLSDAQVASVLDRYRNVRQLQDIARRHYETLVFAAEDSEARDLLQAPVVNPFDFLRLSGDFGKRAYHRVNDMFEHIDFTGCRRFVLVGCGTLPVTLFQVHARTTVPEIIGLDVRESAVDLLRGVIQHHDISRMTAACCDGRVYDYVDADIIYIANIVTPKREVLQRIADTAPRHAQIVLRDPFGLGQLVTECGIELLSRDLTVNHYGPPEPAFLSRNVFLLWR